MTIKELIRKTSRYSLADWGDQYEKGAFKVVQYYFPKYEDFSVHSFFHITQNQKKILILA
ncbi:hypothetical protein CEE37_13125 [candidate division LCP-89 bacterium B3_LCP]|uniref:Uncharacterized protein n=1 Tax=candidate division LCP-89 bacterium B3_LCP TaxID=2012998 RepID=A0A532UU35_UNCL8|nr:MAG: hypothetical protein CEE37_13125 [candidate division LCP-89 bacterium B3_LCP]